MNEQILCISYFDEVLGPNIFYCGNAQLNDIDHPDLGRILEFQEGIGAFIFSFRKYQLISHLFYIESKKARGGKILMMIAYMIKASYFRREIVDVYKFLESKKPILKSFEMELRSLEQLPMILQKQNKTNNVRNLLDLGSKDFKNQFLEIYDKYYKELSPKYELSDIIRNKTILKKIFMFGTPNSGKTSFIRNLEVIQFHNQNNNDLFVKFYDVIVDNFEILTDECFKTDFNCVKCKSLGTCTENAQAFIQLINLTNKESLKESRLLFEKVIEHWDLEHKQKIPLILIGNIFEEIERKISKKELFNFFQFDTYKSNGVNLKYFEANIMRDDEYLYVFSKFTLWET
ncbi:MAG: hypothetical protein P8Y70_07520, partial [Candidatus Lokiarchaeota archaeon]